MIKGVADTPLHKISITLTVGIFEKYVTEIDMKGRKKGTNKGNEADAFIHGT